MDHQYMLKTNPENHNRMHSLKKACGLTTNAQLLDNAVTLFFHAVHALLNNKKIALVNELAKQYDEVTLPCFKQLNTESEAADILKAMPTDTTVEMSTREGYRITQLLKNICELQTEKDVANNALTLFDYVVSEVRLGKRAGIVNEATETFIQVNMTSLNKAALAIMQ